MSPATHAIAAYAVTILLLWGYAAALWLSARRRRTIHSQDIPGDKPQINPETIRGESGGRSDPS